MSIYILHSLVLNIHPIFFVALASEPVGGRSRATELRCLLILLIFKQSDNISPGDIAFQRFGGYKSVVN